MANEKSEKSVIHLDDKKVRELKPQPEKNGVILSVKIHWDDVAKRGERGLGVLVTRNGAKSFIFQYRFRGRARRLTIGDVKTYKVAEARAEALACRQAVARGLDPAERKLESRRRGMTVAELWADYLEGLVDTKSPSTLREYQRLWRKRLEPAFGSKLIDSVTTEHVRAFHRKMRKEGAPISANRAIAQLSGLFTYALKRKLIKIDQHPVKGFDEKSREVPTGRALTEDELGRFLAALAKAEREGLPPAREHRRKSRKGRTAKHRPKTADIPKPADPYAVAALRCLYLTGWRPGEVLPLKWTDVNLDHGLLTLRRSKTGFVVHPIPGPVMDLLRSLPRVPGNPHVFVGATPKGYLTDLKRLWGAVRQEAGLQGVRMYWLRHSHTTTGAMRYGPVAMQQIRAHRNLATTERYLHVPGEHVRAVAEAVATDLHARMMQHGAPLPKIRLAK